MEPTTFTREVLLDPNQHPEGGIYISFENKEEYNAFLHIAIALELPWYSGIGLIDALDYWDPNSNGIFVRFTSFLQEKGRYVTYLDEGEQIITFSDFIKIVFSKPIERNIHTDYVSFRSLFQDDHSKTKAGFRASDLLDQVNKTKEGIKNLLLSSFLVNNPNKLKTLIIDLAKKELF